MIHTNTRYTVIGSGHGGRAMAAHLALMGFHTTLFNRTPERVAAIRLRGASTWNATTASPVGSAPGPRHLRLRRSTG